MMFEDVKEWTQRVKIVEKHNETVEVLTGIGEKPGGTQGAGEEREGDS